MRFACLLYGRAGFSGHPADDVEDAQERQTVRPSNAGLNVLEPRPDLRIPERAPDGFPEVPEQRGVYRRATSSWYQPTSQGMA